MSMKKFQPNTAEQMLFALLRASLHEKEVEINHFENCSAEDWQHCYRLACEQGVMALAWDAVLQLPKELQPGKQTKLAWATNVERYENKYLRYCECIDELSRFYAQHHIETMVLKGLAVSSLYPRPSHREGGDIDIYTYSAKPEVLSHEEANALADKLMQEQGIAVELEYYKHSNFVFKGVAIENHKTFLNVQVSKVAQDVEKFLHANMQPERVKLAKGEVLRPSKEFNTLFIAFHAAQHYCSGLSLHHLCDWAIILRRYGLAIPEEISDKKFIAGMQAFTILCNKYLGCNIDLSLAPELEASKPHKLEASKPHEATKLMAEEIAEEMMGEILHPLYVDRCPHKNKVAIFMYKLRRMIHRNRLSSKIISASFWREFRASFIIHLKKPESIFG